MGVFYIQGETVLGEKLPRLATIYLLIIKLIYDEQMETASASSYVYTSLGEINEKIGDFGLLKNLSSATEMRKTISLLKKYQIIEPMDVLQDLNEESRMVVYPCINAVLLRADVQKLIETFTEEDERGEEDGEQTGIQSTIEDLSE